MNQIDPPLWEYWRIDDMIWLKMAGPCEWKLLKNTPLQVDQVYDKVNIWVKNWVY